MNQEKWDITFLKQALLVAERHSKDTTKVGALIARESYPLSFGYNGIIRGYPDFGLEDRTKKLTYTEHAEKNALFNALRNNINIVGSTMYCTRFPCHECTKAIIQSGIKRIVYIEDYGTDKWRESVEASLDMTRKCEIQLVSYAKDLIYASPTI